MRIGDPHADSNRGVTYSRQGLAFRNRAITDCMDDDQSSPVITSVTGSRLCYCGNLPTGSLDQENGAWRAGLVETVGLKRYLVAARTPAAPCSNDPFARQGRPSRGFVGIPYRSVAKARGVRRGARRAFIASMDERDLHILRRILDRGAGFSHREHIELAWCYLGEHDIEGANRVVAAAIRHVARLHGAPGKYHATITRAWVHLVALHRAAGDAASFEEFIAAHPRLLDQHLVDHHYSPGLIRSEEARTRWIDPDLRALPALA